MQVPSPWPPSAKHCEPGVAPMEGVSDFPLRFWLHMISAPSFTWTPFWRVTPSNLALPKVSWWPEGLHPQLKHSSLSRCIPQLMTASTDDFCRVAEQLLEQGAPWVDLNCGCPSARVVGNGAGSSLLAEPQEQFFRLLKTASSRLGAAKISVKIRTGYSDHPEDFDGILEVLRLCPLRHVTIHGRTRPQGYSGRSDWKKIYHAAETLPSPVVGSGDVESREQALLKAKQRQNRSLGGVIIGRGALKNPWLFKTTGTQTPPSDQGQLMGCIEVFLVLTEAFKQAPDQTMAACSSWLEAWQTRHPPTDEPDWQQLSAKMQQHFQIALDDDRSLSSSQGRFTLGRLKMLWGYLCQNRADRAAARLLLRSRSLSAFREGLMRL